MLTSLSSSVAGVAELLPQSAEQRELLRSRCRPRSTRSIRSTICSIRRSTGRIRRRRPVPRRSRPRRSCGWRDIASVSSAVQPGIGQPLHRAARARHRRQCRRPRPRLDRRRHPDGDRRDQQGPADHHEDPDPRPERGDAELVPQPGSRHDPGGHPGLCAAGHAVPVLGRSVHHHDGGARRADRHPVDAGAVAAPRSTSNR